LSIVVTKSHHLEHLDIKILFLRGNLKEDIFMTRLESGFEIQGKKNHVYKH